MYHNKNCRMLFSSTQNYVKHRAMQKKQQSKTKHLTNKPKKNHKTKLNILKNKTNIPLHLV